MELILLIAIIAVFKILKAALDKAEVKPANQSNGVTYQMSKQATRVNSAKVQMQQQTSQWQQAARENIARAKQRAQERSGELYEQMNLSEYAPKQKQSRPQQQKKASAMQQIHEGRVEARNTTIVQRAKANADEDKVDVTLETMEAEHNHSERVSAAIHHHPEDVIPENMLGNIEDLMVKGYDGNLCFERDFVGEGMDMISRFSLGGNYGA